MERSRGTLREMSMSPPQNIPRPEQAVPSWIYGLAFLISTILSSGVAAYLAVQSSVDKWIDANKEIRILELRNKELEYAENSRLLRIDAELSELRNRVADATEKTDSAVKTNQEKLVEQEIKLDTLQKKLPETGARKQS